MRDRNDEDEMNYKYPSVLSLLFCSTIIVGSCTHEVCKTYTGTPKFPFPGSNVAVIGNCIKSNIQFESMLIRNPESQYRVIERTYLESVLKEKGLSVSGVVEPHSYSDIGNIAKVDALLITDCASGERRFRFVKVTTGEVLESGAYAAAGDYASEYEFVRRIMPWTATHCWRESILK